MVLGNAYVACHSDGEQVFPGQSSVLLMAMEVQVSSNSLSRTVPHLEEPLGDETLLILIFKSLFTWNGCS